MLTTLRHRSLGVIFLVLILLGVWLTYAVFSKKFTDYAEVTLETSRVGLSLPTRADVKVRGVLVGEVLDTEATADGARLTLGLDPDEMDTIPADVSGSILPKTLFGEKYVSLVVPDDAGGETLRAGATIERTQVATEIEAVLNDLYPLLRTVQPADLNQTLNALATALEGRGEQLGSTITTADAYLKRLNPQIPALVEDLRLTASVSNTYSDVMPQIAQILQDTVTTTGTLEENSAQLQALFTNVTATSATAQAFLSENEDNLIKLAVLNDGLLEAAARYAPEYPCLLGGIDNLGNRVAETFRGYMLHINLEMLPRQPRKYTPADKPRIGDDRGPACGNLPNPPWSQQNPLRTVPSINDGVQGSVRRAPVGFGYAGTAGESALIAELLAPELGVEPSQVPDVGSLLVGPLARGATVSAR